MKHIHSHSCHRADFGTSWYRRWAKQLLQDDRHRQEYALFANKFWQNAVMSQILWERGFLKKGAKAIGFGVGQERLPALFAKHGVFVTATDQDFTTQQAGHWSEHELAVGNDSLNQLGICPPKKFAQLVEYRPVSMANLPSDVGADYDFLWSNCALGHLGSIPAGLAFIEESLRYLKPGGLAVHTTELNILSDEETVTDGDTIIFRLRDLYHLHKRLLVKGYIMEIFRLTLGDTTDDQRINLAPKFGNDYSKLHFKGHALTQIVLIIHKAKHLAITTKAKSYLSAYRAYRANLRTIRRYKLTNPFLLDLAASRQVPADKLDIQPAQTKKRVIISQGQNKKLRLSYTNHSPVPLFGVATDLHARPIVVGTTQPQNRTSVFHDSSWVSKNRPSATMQQKSAKGYETIEYVAPGQEFSFELALSGRRPKRGIYHEHFALVQEGVGWIARSDIEVIMEVR